MAHCFVVKKKTVAYISFIFGMIFSDYTKNNIQQQKLNLGEKKCVKNAKKKVLSRRDTKKTWKKSRLNKMHISAQWKHTIR